MLATPGPRNPAGRVSENTPAAARLLWSHSGHTLVTLWSHSTHQFNRRRRINTAAMQQHTVHRLLHSQLYIKPQTTMHKFDSFPESHEELTCSGALICGGTCTVPHGCCFRPGCFKGCPGRAALERTAPPLSPYPSPPPPLSHKQLSKKNKAMHLLWRTDLWRHLHCATRPLLQALMLPRGGAGHILANLVPNPPPLSATCSSPKAEIIYPTSSHIPAVVR
jgi:hypothetical protein